MKKLYLIIFGFLLFGIDDAILAAIAATVLGTVGSAATSALNKPKQQDIKPGEMPDVGEAKSPELGSQTDAEKKRRKGKAALTITRESGATGISSAGRSTGATI